MKTVSVFKAQPMPRRPAIESAQLVMEVELPDSGNASYEAARATYAGQGKLVVDLLVNTLPGGTVDAVLIELLQRKASLFTVPHMMSDHVEKPYG